MTDEHLTVGQVGEWYTTTATSNEYTYFMLVPGGYVIRYGCWNLGLVSMVFVPGVPPAPWFKKIYGE